MAHDRSTQGGCEGRFVPLQDPVVPRATRLFHARPGCSAHDRVVPLASHSFRRMTGTFRIGTGGGGTGGGGTGGGGSCGRVRGAGWGSPGSARQGEVRRQRG